MGEKDKVLETTVKYKGFFEYSELYSYVYDWLKDAGFSVKEPEYSEKISGTAKDIDIKWESDKEFSDYYKAFINLTWKIIRMEDAEVQVDGEKKSMNKGDLKIKIKVELESDAKNEWNKTRSLQFFRGVYDKYIIDKQTKDMKKKASETGEDLASDIKSFLNVEGKS
jgi:hypothetical protein